MIIISDDSIVRAIVGAIQGLIKDAGDYEFQRGVHRGKLDTSMEDAEQKGRLISALKRIANIQNGPDRGSAQFQIDCAVEIAETALGARK